MRSPLFGRCAAAAGALMLAACGSLPFDRDSKGLSIPITPFGLWMPGVQPLNVMSMEREQATELRSELRLAQAELARYAKAGDPSRAGNALVAPPSPESAKYAKYIVTQVDPLPAPVVKWERGREPRAIKVAHAGRANATAQGSAPYSRPHSANMVRTTAGSPSRSRVTMCSWRVQDGRAVGIKCP